MEPGTGRVWKHVEAIEFFLPGGSWSLEGLMLVPVLLPLFLDLFRIVLLHTTSLLKLYTVNFPSVILKRKKKSNKFGDQ